MSMWSSILFLSLALLLVLWGGASLRIALQRLQQSSYRNIRYWRRLFAKDTALFLRDFRHFQVVGAFIVGVAMVVAGERSRLLLGMILIPFLWILFRRAWLATRSEKKPFVYTARAQRLSFSCGVVLFLPVLWSLVALEPAYAIALSLNWIAWTPLLVLVGNALVLPLEYQVKQFYLQDATRKRKDLQGLHVIGITGSYGKTSTKHFIHGILSRRYLTYMTPGSVNTELGLAREIREQLKPMHEFFIAEMGARESGDIAQCVRVAQPTWGVLTCIGKAHLETFGSEAAIRATKGELLEGVPPTGVCFLNANDPNTPEMRRFVKSRVVTFGIQRDDTALQADVCARNISVTQDGSTFLVSGEMIADPFEVRTELLGVHNISNLMAAIAVAVEAGMSPSVIQAAVQSLPPVEHRLQLLKKSNGVLVIDDAFNSNPEGFREALDTLALFTNRRRVLVTPGMVELGEQEQEENRRIGGYAAPRVNHVVLVGEEERISPLREGLLSEGFLTENIEEVKTLRDAAEHLSRYNKPGDVVLFENDLPDLYG
ncbi:MAG: UDP-N-acetylmuramoyl-tripeptide--D-alanyl-D-alanine ligase [Bdellovibrionota bacterium]